MKESRLKTSDPTHDQTFQEAIACHAAGRLQDAERLYLAVLKADPHHPDANHNLGVLAMQLQQPAAALPRFKAALEANRNHGQYWISYIDALIRSGMTEAAHSVLAQGRQYGLQGKAADALTSILDGPSPDEKNLLVMLFEQKRYKEEESLARGLVERFPRNAFVWKALGTALKPQGRGREALEAERKAAELAPEDPEVHNNLGNTYQDLGQLPEAEACYRRALEISQDYAEAHTNLGIILNEQNRPVEAETSYRRALELNPNSAKTLANLGNTLHDLGRLSEAEACHRRAMEAGPDEFRNAVGYHLLLPVIPESLEEIARWRKRYGAGIEALMDSPGFLEEPGKNVNPLSFYLAYHNLDDRPLIEGLHRVFRTRVPALTFTSPHLSSWRPPAVSGRRIRVGFLSELLRNHTIGKLNQGFIRHLDRGRFEVTLIHTPKSVCDDLSRELDASADRVLTLPGSLKNQQEAIAAAELDVLYYPDIGMAPSTYFLAYARLAAVQATTLGHPDTTGLDTMDYFVSAASIEPEGADEYYTERLIRMNRIPCYYQPLIAPTEIPSRAAQGLPETGTLYGCPQSLFKFHPDFDAVLAAIVEGDPTGRIVLLCGKNDGWSGLLKARWAKNFPILMERTLFLPLLPLDRFMALMAVMDVLLDPIHFGSGNTLYEAMVYGTPFVTWPGRFMRARIVAAAYRQMGISDAPIAERLEDYAPLALALGRDPERSRALREASKEAADRHLYADMEAVREFEDFMEAAVSAAGQGEKLHAGWRPDRRPDVAETRNPTGSALQNRSRFPEADDRYSRAPGKGPHSAEAYNRLGIAHQEKGRLRDAEVCFSKALRVNPDYVDAYNNLGLNLKKQGRPAEAESNYRQALKHDPDCAWAYNNLGVALQEQGRFEEAEAGYRRALEIDPNFTGAHHNLGHLLREQGRLAEAEAQCRGSLEIHPHSSEAINNLANVLQDQGRLAEAEADYRRALEFDPDYAEAHCNLGHMLREQGRCKEAEEHCCRALAIKPDLAQAHSNLGAVLQERGEPARAETSFRRALELNPNSAKTLANLGNTLHDLGRLSEAEACHRRAMEAGPEDLRNAAGFHLLLPVIPGSLEEIARWRKRYKEGIEALIDSPGSLEEPGKNVNPLSFYLAYHNLDDRPLIKGLHRLFRTRVPALTFTSPHLSSWRPPAVSGRRIRVGFLSELLRNHTIGKLNQGFIRHLDRGRFEVTLIHTPKSVCDDLSRELDAAADRVLTLPGSLKNQQEAVAAAELDVLYYPDIGMAPSTYFLAYARLAPVQATTLGHPDTTGLDTMDYFVSAASIEPEEADEYYTERLIRMNRIPCYYQPLIAPTEIPSRAAQGLPETGTLYGCPQSLFKFHPDFDAVLAAIAQGDPTGRIVLLEGKQPVWSELLKSRWSKSAPILLDRVLFLPKMATEQFMALMAHMDVLLDPIHFGSGNTLYEAMVYGTPFVTWPGRFMRARIVAAAYRRMGIPDAPIAERLEDYAPLALALGRDAKRRRALREASKEAAGRELYADMKAVRELETFMEAAVSAAGQGEKLPAGWRPDIEPSGSFVRTVPPARKAGGQRKKTK